MEAPNQRPTDNRTLCKDTKTIFCVTKDTNILLIIWIKVALVLQFTYSIRDS